MPKAPNRTDHESHVSGVYRSVCHDDTRTVLEGQPFPRCGYCNIEASWVLIKRIKPHDTSESVGKSI